MRRIQVGVYSLGLGAPFLAVAVLFDRLAAPLTWLRLHGTAVTATSAAVLGAPGSGRAPSAIRW